MVLLVLSLTWALTTASTPRTTRSWLLLTLDDIVLSITIKYLRTSKFPLTAICIRSRSHHHDSHLDPVKINLIPCMIMWGFSVTTRFIFNISKLIIYSINSLSVNFTLLDEAQKQLKLRRVPFLTWTPRTRRLRGIPTLFCAHPFLLCFLVFS